jgi:hypothetical protein
MFNCTLPGAITATSIVTHSGFHQSSIQTASCVFLCLKSGNLELEIKIKLISHVFSTSLRTKYFIHCKVKWNLHKKKIDWLARNNIRIRGLRGEVRIAKNSGLSIAFS